MSYFTHNIKQCRPTTETKYKHKSNFKTIVMWVAMYIKQDKLDKSIKHITEEVSI